MQSFTSIYRGRVVNTIDPQAGGRVQVSVPSVLGGGNIWAQTCKPLGVLSQGPSIGDSVWVMFEGGAPDRPVVMGTIGNG